jgi:hypothetical protein
MADCFISFSNQDEPFARQVHTILTAQQIDVFLAPLSIRPGDHWGQEIRNKLAESSWVIFLASAAACRSPYAQQEIGMALALKKRLVPVIWDIQPADLPGWLKDIQALDLRGLTIENFQQHIVNIADGIQSDKVKQFMIALAAILAALFVIAALEKR